MKNSTQNSQFPQGRSHQGRPHLALAEIKTYLNDGFSDEEALEIEYHLADCVLCRNAVETIARRGIEEIEEMSAELSRKMQEHIQEAEEEPDDVRELNSRKPIPYLRYGSLAAAVLLLVIVGYFFIFPSNSELQDFQQEYFADTKLNL